ncbi:MAG TPA: class I SAM-dependent methyltransferase [Gemmatimonadaceae bacterium]|jgi:SAM-dependent methyltransferase
MDHREVGRYWNDNADAWTQLARAGYDIYRDHLNSPAFFEMLPTVDRLKVLDIGCGEGENTRRLARLGAQVTAIDIADRFVARAIEGEQREPLGIHYQVASAIDLPFDGATFDAATAFMSLMDIAETERAIAEAHRVLKPGGFLQFSITHPCFDTPRRRPVRDDNGEKVALEVAGYFEQRDGLIEEWLFGAAPAELKRDLPPFRVPRFTRTLSSWLNLLIATGFVIERVNEPYPSDEVVAKWPRLKRARVVADFLQLLVRKPA